MSHHVINYDCKCKSCGGTGLYRGFAEKNGFAVVCHDCEGSGKTHVKIEYDDFEGREEKKGVIRVLQTNPGISVGMGQSGSSSGKDNPQFLGSESFGGLSYEDWKAGKKFGKGTEMRDFCCPAWWYQNVDCNKKPNWSECCCGGSFKDCKNFKSKDKCWNKFDKQN